MRFRTLALALALACGLSAIGEAKKTVVRPQHKATKAVKNNKKFKAAKYKNPKRIAKKRTVKH